MAALVGAFAMLFVVMAGAASADPVTTDLYAYAAGGAAAPTACPQTSLNGAQCTLSEALALTTGGGNYTIYLETPSSAGDYAYVAGTTVDGNVTIEPDAGITAELEGASGAGDPYLTITGGTVELSGNTANAGSLIVTGATDSAIETEGTSAVTVDGVDFSDDSNGYVLQILDLGNQAVGGAINDEDGGGGTLTVDDSQFTGDAADGAIAALEGNEDDGGAIYINDGTVQVKDSEFDDDSAQGVVPAAGTLYNGGAIFTAGGTLNVWDSTFAGDYVEGSVASVGLTTNGMNGGAIANTGAGVTVSTSTFAGDYTQSLIAASLISGSAVDGGAIYTNAGTTSVNSSTFSGNSLKTAINLGLGGTIAKGPDIYNSASTTVAGNIFADGCFNNDTLLDDGYNVATDSSCENDGPGDISNATDGTIDLSSLAYWGGDTQTLLPGATSVADGVIAPGNTVPAPGVEATLSLLCPTTDQRGVYTGATSDCDAGSVQDAFPVLSTIGPDVTYPASSIPAIIRPTYSGFIAGEGPADLGTQSNCTPDFGSMPVGTPGTYPLVCSTPTNYTGLSSPGMPDTNYVFTTPVDGQIIVTGGGTGPTTTGTTTGTGTTATPVAPMNLTPPTIVGTVGVGKTVTCKNGTWTGTPTPTYTYQWFLDGSPIFGATGKTYKIAAGDAGENLVCKVTAHNSAGTVTVPSASVKVPVKKVKGCGADSGSLKGITLDKIKLGSTLAAIKKEFKGHKFRTESKGFIVCQTPSGIRVEHPTAKLLRAIPKADRAHWKDRAVLLMTNAPRYAFRGVRPGSVWSTAKKDFHFVGKYFVNGAHYYVIRNGKSDVIIKVVKGMVFGIGLAYAAFEKTKQEREAYTSQYYSNPY